MTDNFEYRFPSGFALARQLMEISEDSLSIPLDAPFRDIFVLQHLRCHRFFAAGTELCRVGYAVESETFARNILEALISLRYMMLDLEHRAQLFRNYSIIEMCTHADDQSKAMAGILERVKKGTTDPVQVQQAKDEYTQSVKRVRELKKRYGAARKQRQKWREEFIAAGGRPIDDSWSFVSNYKMAEESDMGITFHLTYKSLSEAVHPTLRSSQKYTTKQGGLMFSPSALRMRTLLMTLITLQMEMVRTVATYYNRNDLLLEILGIEKGLFEIKDSDEAKYDDPIVGLT